MVKKASQKVQKQKSGFQRKYAQIFKDEKKVKEKTGGTKSGKGTAKVVKKKKKERKESGTKKSVKEQEVEQDTTASPESANKTVKSGKKPRFILFVGNLPYTVTKEALSDHFKKAGGLEEVRLLLNAQKEPRGCAFVEYKTSAAMLNALLYHHTTFQERKINVEMTCGGGGNSAKRKKKLQEKRIKSNELIHKMLVQKKKTKTAIK